ncbi:RNA 2',3'-cyclic phosphodiesterase [Candidatus Bathyarchaeota archaeon]|nr:RNA 2',3'-cyclic phosphodiesterase [Candidatus Bathyarchaeota archaeon]
MAKIRSFVAVDVEDHGLRQRFAEFQKGLLEAGADLKLVAPENMHLTLRFLGEIEEGEIHRVIDVMSTLSIQPFAIRFIGAGAFPSLNRINAVWVGIRDGSEELTEIVDELEPRLRTIGIPPDRKGFSPHLTIARVKTGRNKDRIAELIRRLSDRDFGSLRVESIRLKKSVLTPSGPRYYTIFEVKT